MIKTILSHIVPVETTSMRLSDYVPGIFDVLPSKKGMKKAIDKGWVYVNGKVEPTAKFIHPDDVIELHLPENFKKSYDYPIQVV